jgi:hypothetical protein
VHRASDAAQPGDVQQVCGCFVLFVPRAHVHLLGAGFLQLAQSFIHSQPASQSTHNQGNLVYL